MTELEVFILQEWIIAGEYQWSLHLTLDEAQKAAADKFSPDLRWGEVAYDRDTDAPTMFDTTNSYAILRMQTGKFYRAYRE